MLFQLFSIFVDVVTPVFALVLIGYIAGPRLNIEARSLSRTAYFIFIPAFVFNIISTAQFELALALQMTIYIVTVHVACAIVAFSLAKLLGRTTEMAAAYVLIATFGNVGNFGLSLIEFRLGEVAMLPATVYFLAISMSAFVICVGIASWAQGSGLGAVASVFKTPALLALIPAAFFVATEYPVPLFIARLTGLLGAAMIPTMLVTLGVQLAEVDEIKFNMDVVAASGVRLLGGPILATLIVIPFGLTGIVRDAGILQASMPAAVLTSIIAIEYKLIPEFVTTTVLFSTIVSLFTLTIVLTFI